MPDTHPALTRKAIVALTAKAFRVDLAEMTGPSKFAPMVVARYAAMLMVREFSPSASLNRIGNVLGGRDHTTILHGLARGATRLREDREFAATVEAARELIRAWRPDEPKTVSVADVRSVALPVPLPEPENPPAVKKTRPSTNSYQITAFTPEWWAWNNRNFIRAFAKAHPERLPVEMREAAE